MQRWRSQLTSKGILLPLEGDEGVVLHVETVHEYSVFSDVEELPPDSKYGSTLHPGVRMTSASEVEFEIL